MYVATNRRLADALPDFGKTDQPGGGGFPFDSGGGGGSLFDQTQNEFDASNPDVNWPAPLNIGPGNVTILPPSPTRVQAAKSAAQQSGLTAWWNGLSDWERYLVAGGAAALLRILAKPRRRAPFGRR